MLVNLVIGHASKCWIDKSIVILKELLNNFGSVEFWILLNIDMVKGKVEFCWSLMDVSIGRNWKMIFFLTNADACSFTKLKSVSFLNLHRCLTAIMFSKISQCLFFIKSDHSIWSYKKWLVVLVSYFINLLGVYAVQSCLCNVSPLLMECNLVWELRIYVLLIMFISVKGLISKYFCMEFCP